jgi:hypothetical protein
MIRAKIEETLGHKARALGLLAAALLVAASLMLTAKPAHADTFTVTNTNDSGNGSLRKAIEDANARSGADNINFNISGSGVKTILPASQLPTITDPVVINGYSQPGSRPNSRATGAIDAVVLVELSGLNQVAADGLVIDAPNVVVRGLAINLFRDDGIQTRDGAQGARIEGNFIGTDASGTVDRGNSFQGVEIFDGEKHIIGGTTPDKRNIISGNNKEGIALFAFAGQGGHKVQGNLIGTSKDGTSPLGNSLEGIEINSSNNTVGGAVLGAANVIAFHGQEGVEVNGAPNTGNRILNNSIFSNGEEGIDLGNNGRTLNDPKDLDAGPNTLQNFPVLTSAEKASGGTITIKGNLNSTPKKEFIVQFFANPQNEDEGKTFLGQKKVTTNLQGTVSFTFETTKPLSVGDRITATATDPGGNTSEFSDPLALAQV